MIAVVGPSEVHLGPDAALLFGLHSSTGKHHFDPVSRGCQLGWHCFDEAAHQAGLAITANDFRQPSLDIDQAPSAVVVISQKIRQSATSPSSWSKAARGTGQVSEFCLHGRAGVMSDEVRHPFAVANGSKMPSAVEGMEPG